MKTILVSITILFTTFLAAQTIPENDLKDALSSDNAEAFKKLVNKETKDACLKLGQSSYNLLALTIKLGAKNCFDSLLLEKPDLNKSCASKTPLMYAVKYGRLDMVKALVKAGANHKTKTSSGITALDYAEKYSKTEIKEYLESL